MFDTLVRGIVDESVKQHLGGIVDEAVSKMADDLAKRVVEQLAQSQITAAGSGGVRVVEPLTVVSNTIHVGVSFLSGVMRAVTVDTDWKGRLLTGFAMGGILYFSTRWRSRGGPIKVVLAKGDQSSVSYTLESVRANSRESSMILPKCQRPVGYFDGEQFVVHGSAIRIDDVLVMPEHVYASSGGAQMQLSSGRFLDLRSGSLPVTKLDTDVVMVRVSPAEMSQLGLKNPSICHELPDHGALVSICGPLLQGTTAALKPGKGFGTVVYEGTTRPGYSGAAYMKGDVLMGMHRFGGQLNGGNSASYLACLVRWENGQYESSEDWLNSAFRAKKRIIIDRTWNGLDEQRISVGGKVAMVSRETYNRLLRDHPEVEVVGDYEDFAATGSYQDESLGFRQQEGETLSGLPLLEQCLVRELRKHPDLISGLRTLSPSSLRKILQHPTYFASQGTTTSPKVELTVSTQASTSTPTVTLDQA